MTYINTSGNWGNEELCGNMKAECFAQFRVFKQLTFVNRDSESSALFRPSEVCCL